VAGDEERCGLVCINLFDLSEGKGGAPKTRDGNGAGRVRVS